MNTIKDSSGKIVSANKIGRNWQRIGYRIKGKISSLVAEEHGNKLLRDGTKQKLHKEIMEDLEQLAYEKKVLEQLNPEILRGALKGILRQKQLWRNKGKSLSESYNHQAVESLLKIPKSSTEIAFVRAFLSDIIKINKDTLDNILLNPKYR